LSKYTKDGIFEARVSPGSNIENHQMSIANRYKYSETYDSVHLIRGASVLIGKIRP